MSNFIVSARKYRPATFDTVGGQQSITTTLKNAIANNHLAQAYLFCGPRGVGKTTCARIFAKTINCQNLGPDTEACNQCESCLSFNDSRSYNIHELDAASNNSVEDIRNLTDQVRIPPQLGKYSIYIIDEVHMLSQAAFNAFLKTLEEPPSHAIFILATTEKHKIIPTILSRCQIFDFNRIRVQDTVTHLENISKKEGVTYEPEAFTVIAQKADGGMRDALSIFDQIVSFSGNHITYKSVIDNLNILDYEYYFRLTDAFLQEASGQALLIFNEILEKGFDAHNFISGLASHFRDLLVSKDEATLQLMETGPSITAKYKLQASQCQSDFIFRALDICSQADVSFKSSKNQRLHVELALVKLSLIEAEKKKELEDEQLNAEKAKNISPAAGSSTIKPAVPVSKPEIAPSTSIKNLLNKPVHQVLPEKEPAAPVLTPPSSPPSAGDQEFTEEQAREAWSAFASKLEQDQPRMFSMLTVNTPTLGANYQVNFNVNNNLQLDAFNQIKHQLLYYLKDQLQNQSIDIQASVPEETTNNKLYTPADKFNRMVEKNPDLNKLKQQFNLDFE
jgi:DNA polymerase III subunit gamma/tau